MVQGVQLQPDLRGGHPRAFRRDAVLRVRDPDRVRHLRLQRLREQREPARGLPWPLPNVVFDQLQLPPQHKTLLQGITYSYRSFV